MTQTKTISEILAELKAIRAIEIMEKVKRYTERLEACSETLDDILRGAREWDWDMPSKFDYELGEYGNYLTISGAQDKEAYEHMLLCLVDLYGEGKREKGFWRTVDYKWDTPSNVNITFKVATAISGCKLVKKKEYVPQVVIPETTVKAHWEETTELECVS